MKTHQEAALETNFQKIARILARRYGVTVHIRGGQAYVDMEQLAIVLPSIAPGSDVRLEHLDGFLDHECAHVIHTAPKIHEEFGDSDKTLHALWNVVEDVWIERAMGAEYYGCKQNLDRLNVWLYATCEERWPQTDALGKLKYSLERCYRGDHEKEQYADDPDIGAIMMQLQAEIDRGRVCSDSQEALVIARAVLEKIAQLSKGGGGGTKGESRAGVASGGDDGDGGDSRADSSDSGSQESSESGPSDNDDAAESAEGRQAAEACGGGKEDGAEEDQSQADAESAQATLAAAQQQAKDFMGQQQAGGFEQPLDVEGLVNEHLTAFFDWSTQNDPEQYIVFSEEHDYEITYDVDRRTAFTEKYRELVEEVHQYTGHLSSILELTLSAESEDRWVGGARRGKKFDQRRLAYWAEGSDDDRLFKYLEQGVRHDTAVTLLWDCSGSMGRSSQPKNKAALARLAAVAFHEALRRCQFVTHEVLGFNTGGESSKRLHKLVNEASARGDDLQRYSRLEERDARMVFVPFGSDDGRPIVAINGGAANRDGECVLWAARRLVQRPEQRKILIVGSDGHPQGARYHRTEQQYLREVVQRAMAAGLEVYALGIMDDAVADYYPLYRVIRDARELPRAVLTLLTSSLPARVKGRSNEGVARF